MNKVEGTILSVEQSGRFLLATVKVTDQITLKAIALDAPDTEDLMQIGNAINLLFKESEVVIGLDKEHDISLQNKLPGTIINIEKGVLISKLYIATDAGNIVSIISTNSVQRLKLEADKKIIAMIKLNEMMLSE